MKKKRIQGYKPKYVSINALEEEMSEVPRKT